MHHRRPWPGQSASLLLLISVACARPLSVHEIERIHESQVHMVPQAPGAPPADVAEALVPVGQWVDLAGYGAYVAFIGFTYVDPQAGFSVAGEAEVRTDTGPVRGRFIHRLTWRPTALRIIDETERVALGLPERPEWLASYGPQPPPGTLWGTWRFDPRLFGRFHPDYPDDLQVMLVDTGERLYEVVWARVFGCDSERCLAVNLSEPNHLDWIAAGDTLSFPLDTPRDRFPAVIR